MRYCSMAVAAFLMCAGAHADVVYNWETLDAKGAASVISGKLVVEDAAWMAGGAHYSYTGVNGSAGDPASPIVSAYFAVGRHNMNLHPQTNGGYGDSQTSMFDLSLDTEMYGSFSNNGSYARLAMSSANGVWTIKEIGTDLRQDGDSLCWFDVCSGAGVTGQWVLDQSTVPGSVPEPATFGLMGLGLLGLVASRRRQQTRG